jgi:threonine dehydrogenase-like Zn-dependent dehydrogenase
MRALVLEDFGKLVVADRPDPVPGEHDALLEVVATGICGSDLHGYTGENGRRRPGQIMGHETVGRLVALGSEVDGVDPLPMGTAVTINPVIGCGVCDRCRAGRPHMCPDRTVIGVAPERPAAFAELLAVPAANLVPLPPELPVELGALVEPLAVGYHAVRRAPVRPGDTVLVIGGGPIGQACLLAARREGASGIAVSEPAAHRRDLVATLGATALDPAAGDLPGAVAARLGGPPDVVIDAVGSDQSLRGALACASVETPVVLVGMASPALTLPAYEISTCERSLIGSFCYTPAEFSDTARWAAGVASELARLVDGRVDLDGAPAAFERLASGGWPASKVLVCP